MKEVKKLLADELPLAGQPSAVTPQLLKLDGYRITAETQVPQEEFLMRMYGKPCLPRSDLTAVTGVEKCGKTFFISMLMACCAKRQVLELERISELPLKVMWYDTEQSRQSTKGIYVDRVGKMAQPEDSETVAVDETNFLIYNVRACTCSQVCHQNIRIQHFLPYFDCYVVQPKDIQQGIVFLHAFHASYKEYYVL